MRKAGRREQHTQTVQREHLTATFQHFSVTDDAVEGRIMGMASVYSSIAIGARGPTRFAAGAFRESLEHSKTVPLLYQHQDHEPIGLAELTDTAEGLRLDARISDTTRGRDARTLAKDGVLTGISIGFDALEVGKPEKNDAVPGGSVRVVTKARLHEASLVTFPADRQARVRTVHALEGWACPEELQDAFEALILEDGEEHVGRTFSSKNLARMKDAASVLIDMIGTMDDGVHLDDLGSKIATLRKRDYRFEPEADRGGSKLIQARRERREEMEAAIGFMLSAAGVALDGPLEQYAVWTAAYINDLPDSSFAYIEPGGGKDDGGKTTPRSKRHLPFKDKDGKVNLPHLRNALARLEQTKIPDAAKAAARKKLEKAAKTSGVGGRENDSMAGMVEADYDKKAKTFADIIAERKAMEQKWRMESALMDSIRSILMDDEAEDKPGLVKKSVQQFLTAVKAA